MAFLTKRVDHKKGCIMAHQADTPYSNMPYLEFKTFAGDIQRDWVVYPCLDPDCDGALYVSVVG